MVLIGRRWENPVPFYLATHWLVVPSLVLIGRNRSNLSR